MGLGPGTQLQSPRINLQVETERKRINVREADPSRVHESPREGNIRKLSPGAVSIGASRRIRCNRTYRGRAERPLIAGGTEGGRGGSH